MVWHAHVTVATVVEHNGLYLLVLEEIEGDRVINQPAGHLDPRETLLYAAIRETKEETGWIVEPEGVLGISQYVAPSNNVTYIRVTFIAKPVEQLKDAFLDQNIIKPLWLSYEEIKARRNELRSPLVLHDIEQYRKGVCYPLDIIFDHGV